MLPFVMCLLPLVASVPRMSIDDASSENQIALIENGTLKNVRIVDCNHTKLNLSRCPDLRALEKDAFDDVADIETLLLDGNSLTALPDFVFSKLTKLKTLSLVDNQLSSLRNLFVGLENLKLLDISHNLIRHIGRGHFFSLTKSVKILTEGNIFWSISTSAFTNPLLKDTTPYPVSDREEIEEKEIDAQRDAEIPERIRESKTIRNDIEVKMCKHDDIVTSLEIIEKDEDLAEGCIRIPIDYEKMQINLREQNIKGFEKDWYRLQSLPIATLDLSYNNISEITRETLNDLPAYVTYVNFGGNKIHKIPSATIENDHLRKVNFKDNLMEKIEEDAFARTKLRELYVSNNQLQNLDYVHSLPETLTILVANENRVTSIPDDAFSKFVNLTLLNLDDNEIETLRNDIFCNLESLQTLRFNGNNISTIEPDAFKGLTTLKTLDLYNNSIRKLEEGTFADLTALEELILSVNKIAKAKFADLPESLNSLYLDYNEINALEEGSFVQSPKYTLSLNGNRISTIMRGAFDLPTLKDLYLYNNTLTTIDGDSYEGLGALIRLWLPDNQISEIHKGACKNLGSLHILDVSRNPFQKLENGALYGLNPAYGTYLYIYENNLKEIQGGVFDDV